MRSNGSDICFFLSRKTSNFKKQTVNIQLFDSSIIMKSGMVPRNMTADEQQAKLNKKVKKEKEK
jgi:hypothetical protein